MDYLLEKIPDFAVKNMASPSPALERFFARYGVKFRDSFLDFLYNMHSTQTFLKMTDFTFNEFVASSDYATAAFNFLANTFINAVEDPQVGIALLSLALDDSFDDFAAFADRYAGRPIKNLLAGYFLGKATEQLLKQAA